MLSTFQLTRCLFQIAIFSQTLGATLFVSASQSIYQNKLATGITHINGLDVAAVLGSGVSAFRDIVPPTLLPQVVEVAVQVRISTIDSGIWKVRAEL